MKRILVAGATGYLGSFVVKELKQRGYFVKALARKAEKIERMQGQFDELHLGQVTNPHTLKGICQGIDVVFSSIGITRQKDKLTFKDVDYQGNLNLLDQAKAAGVKKFIYVSVLNGPKLYHLDIVKAHEDFVRELKSSGLDYTIIRPTGYFSDMSEFFEMALKGRVFLIGAGTNRVNPIHGADLAVCCADAVEKNDLELDVGGPEIMDWKEIAKLALTTAGKPVKVTSIPTWCMNAIRFITSVFNPHQAGLLAFFIAMSTQDVIGPLNGTNTLGAFYQELLKKNLNRQK